jgi:hypothetical protein
MKEMDIHCVAAKFVPRVLEADLKQQRVDICIEYRYLAYEDEIVLSRVISVDESWIFGYEAETK